MRLSGDRRGKNHVKGRLISSYSALLVLLLISLLFLCPVAAEDVAGADNVTISQTLLKSIPLTIEEAKPGSVIVIESGEWRGNIVIEKPISLIGLDTGTGRPHLVTEEGLAGIQILSDDVTIDGFTISGSADSAVWTEGNRTVITNNRILATPVAISAISGEDLLISENTIINHSVGIYAEKGVSGLISMNNFDNPVNAKSLTTEIEWSSQNSSYIYGGTTYNSSLGNFWNDYKGGDDDGDGIGSVAYMPYTSASDIRDAIGPVFIESLSDEGEQQASEGFWAGLFKDANYVKDKYPLISENSMYIVVPSSGSSDLTAGEVNATLKSNGVPVEKPGEDFPLKISSFDSEENVSAPPVPEGGIAEPSKATPFFSLQHPFEIVFVMVLIAGVFSGIIGIMGHYGRFYSERKSKRSEVMFLALAFGSMSVVLLYTLASYTSRLIYRFIDYGFIQVAFIFVTAYLITSSGFLALGFLRGSIPLTLYRVHAPVAVGATLLFAYSLYSAPVDLGPITGLAYPAALLLSVVLPLVFRRRFRSLIHRWKAESGNGSTIFDPDSTSLFMNEEDIMSSSLSSSYFPESLHEKYSDVEFIGKGGLARVFKAKRRRDGIIVAVKVPINFDETTGRLFLKEMRIWEGLNHPNIAKLNSVNIFPVPYVEMEYLEKTLSSLEKPLSIDESVRIISEVSDGLEYAHSQGIIHRDIKPQNLMLAFDGIAKITDWGLGKIMSDGNETTVVGFSLNYAAPEQVAPKTFGHPDERTDIYQLGIVFYELVTGEKPFSGSGVAEVTDEILRKTPVQPSDAGAESDLLDGLIMKCLEKRPEDRFSSITEFRDALDNLFIKADELDDMD